MMSQRPSRDHILINSAALYALRSTCSRAQVGVIIATAEYRPLVSGYNGAPAGMTHCDHECKCPAKDSHLHNAHSAYCPATKPCTISVHAEANAISYAARYGVRVESGQLFTTTAPCPNCSMLILSAGIERVVFRDDHRDMAGVDLLDKGGVEVVKWLT